MSDAGNGAANKAQIHLRPRLLRGKKRGNTLNLHLWQPTSLREGGVGLTRRPRAGIRVLSLLTILLAVAAPILIPGPACAREPEPGATAVFPRSLDSYGDAGLAGVIDILRNRIAREPLNLVASLIFLFAILHTFLASRFTSASLRRRKAHQAKIDSGEASENSVDFIAEALHFFGEVEVVFGLWIVPLFASIIYFYDWPTVVNYMTHGVDLTEAAFVVVIMLLASTRPILKLAERVMEAVAKLFGGSLSALWFTILTLGPLLGSLITEPAAITISAMLLSRRFYALDPSGKFKYATLALLFVNVSVGGTLTHFAAPPVLMVAGPWGWDTAFMLSAIGWKAVIGILIVNGLYFTVFRGEFSRLQGAYALRCLEERIEREVVTPELVSQEWKEVEAELNERGAVRDEIKQPIDAYVARIEARMEEEFLPKMQRDKVDPALIKEAFARRFEDLRLDEMRRWIPALLPSDQRARYVDPNWDDREDTVPAWVTVVHILFMAWTIVNAHHAQLFVLGALFFLGFAQATAPYQNRINLQQPMLVGFFLAGLVIHGGMQGWWIAPVLSSLSATALMAMATILTAFNDNAALTYLATLVPGFSDGMKYAVVAGAVAGGGLTIIANAPNPAGQSILRKHFDEAVSPKGLLLAASVPTVIVWLCLFLL
ncbi:MAG: putative Na+/H+ antiporter [Acidobacteriota bacterium]